MHGLGISRAHIPSRGPSAERYDVIDTPMFFKSLQPFRHVNGHRPGRYTQKRIFAVCRLSRMSIVTSPALCWQDSRAPASTAAKTAPSDETFPWRTVSLHFLPSYPATETGREDIVVSRHRHVGGTDRSEDLGNSLSSLKRCSASEA
jgi:hypothetical protein